MLRKITDFLFGRYRSYHALMNFIRVLNGLDKDWFINDFGRIHELVLHMEWSKRNTQMQVADRYADALGGFENQKSLFKSSEIKIFSQNGEDGILLKIFSMIGVGNKRFIDFACGGSSNTANLVLNFGWSGLYIGGEKPTVQDTIDFFKSRGNFEDRVKVVQSWITAENINDIFKTNGYEGEIDLISIDIDSTDYWIWEAIEIVKPRVVLIEYNATFGPDKSITVPYKPDFNPFDYHPRKWYSGGSLEALARLGRKKGYSLVCCDTNGVNSFFVRDDLMGGHFEPQPATVAFYEHFQRPENSTEQFKVIESLEYVEIEE